jgi:hypothetical protein
VATLPRRIADSQSISNAFRKSVKLPAAFARRHGIVKPVAPDLLDLMEKEAWNVGVWLES